MKKFKNFVFETLKKIVNFGLRLSVGKLFFRGGVARTAQTGFVGFRKRSLREFRSLNFFSKRKEVFKRLVFYFLYIFYGKNIPFGDKKMHIE